MNSTHVMKEPILVQLVLPYTHIWDWPACRQVCQLWKGVGDLVFDYSINNLFPLRQAIAKQTATAFAHVASRCKDRHMKQIIKHAIKKDWLFPIEWLGDNKPAWHHEISVKCINKGLLREICKKSNNYQTTTGVSKILEHIINVGLSNSPRLARWAAADGHLDLLVKLKNAGVSIAHNEALVFASMYSHCNIVEFLLKEPKIKPGLDESRALRAASINGSVDVMHLLLKDGRSKARDAVVETAREGCKQELQILLENITGVACDPDDLELILAHYYTPAIPDQLRQFYQLESK